MEPAAAPSAAADGDIEEPGMPSTTSRSRVSRANFSSIRTIEENYQKASAVRAETVLRQQELRAQRERFRQRGMMLKAQREERQQMIKSTIGELKGQNAAFVSASRERNRQLRDERTAKEQLWKEYGGELTQQHVQLRNRLKQTQETNRADARMVAVELKESLKKLNEEKDDSTYKANVARVSRVKHETGTPVVRLAKTSFLDARWNSADDLRAELAKLKERRKENDRQYIQQAHVVKAAARATSRAAAEKLEREAKARAERLRVEHEELEKGVKEARAAETHRKRVVIAGVEEGKAVPMEDLVRGGFPTDPVAATEEATDGGSEGLPGLAMFARFFGFRKRGSGQHLSSVVL